MKRLLILIALASALTALLMAPVVFGYQIQIYQNSYSYSNGGEFTVVSLDNGLAEFSDAYTGYKTQGVRGSSLFNFESFCLEYNEHFTPGRTYYAEINPDNKALSGDAQIGYDVISQGTAWLYLQFISGTLQGYDYYNAPARKTSAGLLQQAIWFLEDEGQGNINNTYVQLAITQFGNIGNATSDYAGDDVGVLNVWADSSKGTGFRQDQLIDPAPPVPEPTTLLLLGLGLFGLGLSRRFKK